MALTFEAVRKGHVDEAEVTRRLRAAGFGVVSIGQSMWAPETCPEYGDLALSKAVRFSDSNSRWMADLYAARGGPFEDLWVEVVCCGRDNIALEQAKLVANDYWAIATPVWYVNRADWQAWPHRGWDGLGWDWDRAATSPVMHSEWGNGSGDPFRLFTRAGIGRPFHEVFGGPPEWP